MKTEQTITATTKYYRQSPKKVRAVARKVTQLPLNTALSKLEFSVRKASKPLRKTILSAVANAENNLQIKQEDLYIKEIHINPGPSLRRPNYRAKGKRDTIHKRSSHIHVILGVKDKD